MNWKIVIWILLFELQTMWGSELRSENMQLQYFCTGASSISFDSFKGFEQDYYRKSYLRLVLKPYISNDEREGILSKWNFSPDGSVFRAKISDSAKWMSGRKISAKEAAFSLVKSWNERYISKQVSILGTEKMSEPDWYEKKYSNIKIINDSEFEIKFHSNISVLGGTIKEALSYAGAYNFIWPMRLDDNPKNEFDIVGYHPVTKEKEDYFIIFENKKIKIVTKPNCIFDKAHFTFKRIVPNQNLERFDRQISSTSTLLTGTINGQKKIWKIIENRRKLTSFLRSASLLDERNSRLYINSLILKGEPGYSGKYLWPDDLPESFPVKNLIIGSNSKINPSNGIGKGILARASELKIDIEFIASDEKNPDKKIDLWIDGSKVTNGRQISLQNLANYEPFSQFSTGFKILDIAKTIRDETPSTIPVKPNLLEKLEKISYEEKLFVPISRLATDVFTYKNNSIELVFGINDNLILRKKNGL